MAYAVGFDLEIARTDDLTNLTPRDVLGIACAGAVSSSGEVSLWYGEMKPLMGPFGPKLTVAGSKALLHAIKEMMLNDIYVVTWNGLNFDFHVLGVEAHDQKLAAELATSSMHIDLMFLFCSIARHRLGLKAAAAACGSSKGTDELADGAEAPKIWDSGDKNTVLNYMIQDCRATVDIFNHLEMESGFTWLTKKGSPKAFSLPENLKGKPNTWSVAEVKQRVWAPAPKWLDQPSVPSDFLMWTVQAGVS